MSSMSRTFRRSIERTRNPQPRKYARRGKGRARAQLIPGLNPIQRIRQALYALRAPSRRRNESRQKAGER